VASAKREDVWADELRFLGAARVATTAFPGAKTIRLEAFALSRKEAAALKSRFGGTVRDLAGQSWVSAKARKPIRIRRELIVVESEEAPATPSRKTIVIPAGAAFGTGEHATTASCLRLLCDVAGMPGGKWELLDLGTGSGILAIAASKLGAARVQGWDFDKDAVRIARENVRANGSPNVVLKTADVMRPFPPRRWDVVCANLYSGVLIRASARIAKAVRPGGHLILSGILREQEAACSRAFERRGLEMQRRVRSGKWVAILLKRKNPDRQRPQKTVDGGGAR
jgi:ribosomal protein L11 methyltransferase